MENALDDETLPSTIEQRRVEQLVRACFEDCDDLESSLRLFRGEHASFCRSGANALPSYMSALDCSRAWLCFWLSHSLSMLGKLDANEELCRRLVAFAARCQADSGGFGGGPAQMAHLAPTYAFVMTLVEIGTAEAYQLIDRAALYEFLMRRKDASGGFSVHEGGEVDIRGTYCALACASMCNVMSAELKSGVADWIRSCQTYEGGYGGEPGNEAHGGYAYCGLAAMLLLGELRQTEARRLLRWAVRRQMPFEGGFQGRTNKLVDSCYSFWVGAMLPLLDVVLSNDAGPPRTWLFDQRKLQVYLLACCQSGNGGLRDKPDKGCDLYHTCYSLSGIAMAQSAPADVCIVGPSSNALEPINVLYNLTHTRCEQALLYFGKLSHPSR